MAASRWLRAVLLFLCASDLLLLPPPNAYAADTPGEATPPPRKKKDIRDYNDADMARLLEQWEKDDDIEEGDLPEHKRPSAPIDFSKLFNANYDVQRFIVGSDRAIFMLRDGSYAWEIKDFLVSQDRCAEVTLEGQMYPGKGGGSKEKNKTKPEKAKKKEGDPKPRASKEDNRAGSRREDL